MPAIYRPLLLLVAHFWGAVSIAAPLSFRARIDPRFYQFRDLFQTPSLLIVALENSGYTFSYAGRVKIHNPKYFELERNKAIPFKRATVQYSGYSEGMHHYKTMLDWSAGFVARSLEIKTDVDITQLEQGNIALKINFPMSFLVPQILKGYVDMKIETLLNPTVQQTMLDYLEKTRSKALETKPNPLLERILLDAYNVPRTFLEEPVTLERFLVGILLLWFAIAPILLAVLLGVSFLRAR